MTPADAPNASDRPLVATKPPQDLAAQPIGNTLRTRRIAPSGTAPPGAFHYRCLRYRASRFGPLEAPLHNRRSHSIPIAGTTVPRFSPTRF